MQLPYRPYLREQFSIAYDIYLAIRSNVESRVLKELGRDSPNWRLRNACPACLYKLEGDLKLIFDMLLEMDSNDSLKRVLRRETVAPLIKDGEVWCQRGQCTHRRGTHSRHACR